MNRTWILAFALAVVAPISLVGCGETTETKKTEQVKTPTGTDTKTTDVKETKTGDQKDK